MNMCNNVFVIDIVILIVSSSVSNEILMLLNKTILHVPNIMQNMLESC